MCKYIAWLLYHILFQQGKQLPYMAGVLVRIHSDLLYRKRAVPKETALDPYDYFCSSGPMTRITFCAVDFILYQIQSNTSLISLI